MWTVADRDEILRISMFCCCICGIERPRRPGRAQRTVLTVRAAASAGSAAAFLAASFD
jgi:hypothetical protein